MASNHEESKVADTASVAVSTTPENTPDTNLQSPEALFRRLQHMETSCYGRVMEVFRAQGELTWQKHKILEDLRTLLHVSPQRHRTELMRTEANPVLQKISAQCSYKMHERPLFDESFVSAAERARLAEKGLYSYSDTESEAEDAHDRFRTPTKKSTRRASGTVAASTGPKRRGRKRKDESAGVSTPATKTKRGKVGRPPKEKDDAAAAISAAMDAILAQTDYRDIATLKFEDVEAVAEKEQRQIEELDALLNETVDQGQRQRIMNEVQRKKDKLIQLIQHLEVL